MKAGHYFGCHQMPERSFFYKGYQFPVCARCTGILISIPLAVFCFFTMTVSWEMCVGMSLVMLIDWLIQFANIKQSNNARRFVTGLIGGLGLYILWFRITLLIVNNVVGVICKSTSW